MKTKNKYCKMLNDMRDSSIIYNKVSLGKIDLSKLNYVEQDSGFILEIITCCKEWESGK